MSDKVGLEAMLEVSQFKNGLSIYLRGIQQFNQATRGAQTTTQSVTSQMGGFWRGVGQIVAGLGIYDALRNIGSGLMNVAGIAAHAAGEFQTLQIRFEGLIARELRAADAGLSVADSFQQAVPQAKELNRWIRGLALETPFDTADVANVVAMGMGFGFTKDESKALTMSISNFSAGMGLGNEEIQRIIVNFGQMAAAGKVTGAELRDLARGAFVPVIDIMREAAIAAGKPVQSLQELREAANNGEISVEDFINTFMRFANTEFPDAAERMSRTLPGTIERFSDFIQVVGGIDLLGPLVERFTSRANAAMDRLLEPDVSGFIQAMGEILASGFDSMASLAESAFGYGQNITIQLANGIIAGLGAVLDALIAVGNAIAYWLSPGSPPRILPDLPAWGASAIGEFMKGWGEIDTSLFNDIAGSIEGFLRALPIGGDKGDKVGIVESILGSRQAIADAVSEMRRLGSVSESSFQRIFTSAGLAEPALQDYVRTLFALQGANDKVKEAQDELTIAQKEYDDALKSADDHIQEVSDAEQELADRVAISNLELIMNDPNATALEKERARLKIEKIRAEAAKRNVIGEKKAQLDLAKEKFDSAKGEQDRLEAQARAQQAIIGIQNDQNKLLGEQLKLLEDIAKEAERAAKTKAGEKAPVFKAGGLDVSSLAGQGFDMGGDLAESFKNAFLQKIGETFAPLQAKLAELQAIWNVIWIGLQIAMQPAQQGLAVFMQGFNNLVLAIGADKDQILASIGELTAFIIQNVGIFLGFIFTEGGRILNWFAEQWRLHGSNIIDTVTRLGKDLITFIFATLTLITGILTTVLNLWSGNWEGAWQSILNTLTTFMNIILLNIGTDLDTFLKSWSGTFELAYEIVSKVLGDIALTIKNELGWAIQNALKFFGDLKDYMMGAFMAALGFVQGAFNDIAGAIENVVKWVGRVIDAFSNFKVPGIITPGSPTPLETGLSGINNQFRQMTANLATAGNAMRPMTNNSYQYNSNVAYNLTVNSGKSTGNIQRDFYIMRSLGNL